MIYCVEDDDDIRELELYTLKSMNFEALGFAQAEEFLQALEDRLPELIILDVMLPDVSGTELLRQLRQQPKTARLPIIMATARGAEYEKIQALDLGADDYLTKPFSMMEMVARVRAVLRRCGQEKSRVFEIGALRVDEAQHTVTCEGRDLALTKKEFDLLFLLLEHPGRVYSRDMLLEQIWGREYDGENRTVDVHVRTLRAKLGEQEKLIKTIRGVGYKAEI